MAKLTNTFKYTVWISLCIVSSYSISSIVKLILHRRRDSYFPIDGLTNLGMMILFSYLIGVRMTGWLLLVSVIKQGNIRPVSIRWWSILISKLWVSMRNPQNGKSMVSSWRDDDVLSPDRTWAETKLWSWKERRVLLGDIKAPYSGKPDFITCTNRLAVIKSSVMNRKSSIYLNNRYHQLCMG